MDVLYVFAAYGGKDIMLPEVFDDRFFWLCHRMFRRVGASEIFM